MGREGGDQEGTDMTDDLWKHRSSGMVCRTCMFFVVKATDRSMRVTVKHEGGPADDIEMALALGRCRRHAPTMAGYPAVFENDWCGDHKMDENKI